MESPFENCNTVTLKQRMQSVLCLFLNMVALLQFS